jgi:holin-like protein
MGLRQAGRMLNALTLLVVCQFLGEITARFLDLPLPGPVIGLVLLLGLLVWRGGPAPGLEATGNWLLRHFGLLFVPAGVGVITQLDTLGANWLALLVAIPLSTFAGLVVTGWVMQRLDKEEEG